MRTKTLLLTAALSAAGVATSMAQVYSVNAVGYVNTDLVAGYNLVSNPLIAADNSVAALFEAAPDGTTVFVFRNGAFESALKDFGEFSPASVAETDINPGEGVFVLAPSAVTITFVGEVPQGPLVNNLPAGLSIEASQVPQTGTLTELEYPAAEGDTVYQWLPETQQYRTHIFDFGEWSPALEPLEVGEAFFLSRVSEGTWSRDFDINATQ